MDRNQIIGIVLIFTMIMGYSYFVPKPEITPLQTADSLALVRKDAPVDSLFAGTRSGTEVDSTTGAPIALQDVVVTTPQFEVVFTNKGGIIKSLKLLNYQTFDGKPLYLIAENHNSFQMNLPVETGMLNLTDRMFATTASSTTLAETDSLVLSYELQLPNSQFVQQTYVIRGSDYLIDYAIKSSSAIGQYDKSLQFVWNNDMLQLENDMMENRKVVTTNFFTDELEHLGISTDGTLEEKADAPVKWFTIKHKYFLAGLIATKVPFQDFQVKATVNGSDNEVVKTMNIQTEIPVADIQKGNANYQYFFGPNDYHLVQEVKAEDFEENVYLGYAFLKPINKYFLVPLFNMLEKMVSNYGILIICLVLIVKLLLTPLTYKSYVSMAKMKVLAPELEEIKSNYPDDLPKQQQEQMKLYQQVGVSPLSGCIPVLATMPILFSLFFLFPNLIELRQEAFLWANDLSTYDAFIKLPFTVPFYGNHISLFTILMTVSSIGYAYYSNQMTPTQPGPINMKYMAYFMPVMFMFFLNSFPAGLTFYYFVSNLVTIGQQLIIRKFVDDTKIRQILDENRKKNQDKPQKKSKFGAYIEKSLQAAEEAKKRQEELERRAGKRK